MLAWENAVELSAVEARFRALVVDWGLGRIEVAALLDLPRDALGLDLVPTEHAPGSETRMRLLIDIARELSGLMSATAVPAWVRQEADDILDSGGQPLGAPLAFLSGPIANVRAMRGALCAIRR